MKKMIALTLILTTLLCLFGPLDTFADTSGYYTYTVSNGEATITGCDTTISGSVTIPSTLGGYPVTSIGFSSFPDCTSLTSIIIPDSVTSIGAMAFHSCTNLTSVTIPDAVTSIDFSAFQGCTSLTSIIIPDGVTSIGNWAFYGCTNLTNITIPDSVTSIGVEAFVDTGYYNNTSNWDNGVLYIGSGLIEAKKNLSGSYSIKQGVVCISRNAFYGCTNLTNITIPDSVISINYSAFSGCTSLTSIIIPDSVTNIADNAFEGCTALKNQSNSGSSNTLVGAFLEKQITVTLNGELISFDVQPVNINGRVLVPVRAIFEALGATVDWNGEKKEVISTKDDITIKMYQDDATMYKNGQPITLDVPAKNIDGRILVPIRAISEAFGCNVDWDGGNSCVVIRMSSVIEKPSIDFDAKMQKGISYFNQGLYYEAIDEIQSFCDENWGVLTPEQQEIALDYLGKSKQNLADYHYNLGVENYNKGLYYEAQKLFTECLKYYTANSAQWQRANDYLYDTNQKIKELENKQYYSGTEIPSYTSFTGREAYITIPRENGVQYLYKYPIDYSDDSIINESTKYMTKLRTLGWKAYSEVEIEYGISYYFLKGSSMIGVSIEFKNYTVTIGIISK